MVAQVRIHITKSNNLGADMTLSRAAAVDQFMGSETGQHDLRIIELGVRVAFLWNKQMTKLTQNQLPGAFGGSMLCKCRKPLE